MSVLGLLAAFTLLWLPGAWVAFGLFRPLSRSCQWALSIAFSPAVVALEVVALAGLGCRFSTAAWLVAPLNLPAAWLLRRTTARIDASRAATWVSVVGLFALAAPLVAPLLLIPGLRTFGWHHMMQLSAMVQIAKLPAIPEEMDLAGVRLSYGWLGHVALAAISTLVDRAPTLFYPLVNASLLVATFLLIGETARRLRPAQPTLMTLGAVAACLSTGLISMLANWVPLTSLVTETRPIPLVAKLPFIDAMNVGFALLAGYVHVTVERFRVGTPRLWLYTGLFVVGVGLSYPLLFPAAALVALAGLAGLWLGSRLGAPASSRGELAANALALAGAIAVCLAYTRFMQDGRHVHVVSFERHAFLHGAKAALLIFGPWLPVVGVQARRALAQRELPRLLLVAAGAANLLAFLALSMPSAVQYKFLFCVGLCWTPLMADWFTERFIRLGAVAATAAVAVLAAMSAGFVVRVHRPNADLTRVAVDESSFPPRVADARFAWLNAVRDRTPARTLIVHEPSFVPTAVLANRSAYMQSNARDQDPQSWRLGYSMPVDTTLLSVKSYPAEVYRARQAVVAQAFEVGSVDGPLITHALLALGRPVVIWFERPSSYSRWLIDQGVGESKFGDRATMTGPGRGVAWYLPETSVAGTALVQR